LKVLTRKILIAEALKEIQPFLKRGYTSYVETILHSVIMKARDEFPGFKMDENDPGIPAHVRNEQSKQRSQT